ncbi:hypothetical protein ACFONG_13255 [Uliginosibacterium paludis]|uniref:Uncharacterized protein n=1 Tax=Uliginosibacterium paludis TaxID=1615952 RepID=A0ABV2CPV0_9RHOO
MTTSFAFGNNALSSKTCRVAQPGVVAPVRASGGEARRDAAGQGSPVYSPTTIAMAGALCGTAFAAGLAASGWPPAAALPEFVAMISAGLFSIAGGCLGLLVERLSARRQR